MKSRIFRQLNKHHQTENDTQRRELAAFLPAALEIQQTPPNPKAKWLARTLLLFVTIIITWACIGHVNIVATAEGKIIPSSRVKKIQPLQKGVVKSILVTEGEYVTKGQALIELDSTLTGADESKLTTELSAIRLQLLIDKKMAGFLENPETASPAQLSIPLNPVFPINERDILLSTRLLQQQWQRHKAQLTVLQNTQLKNKAEQAAIQATIVKLEKTLPISTKRTETIKQLWIQGMASEVDYLTLEQERIQQQQDLVTAQQNLEQLKAASLEITWQEKLYLAQAYSDKLAEITSLQQQEASTEEELKKAQDLNNKQILYAPVNGQVQELEINTIGGVVTDAQQLMLIVPDENTLTVEAFLENQDIGFVHEGMDAEIKIHTFPFTKYGIINATIKNVSDDAIVDENKGLVFSMELQMEKNTLIVEGKEVRLTPGMSVTAEVQMGERRLIEFFLSPLLRHKKESLRER